MVFLPRLLLRPKYSGGTRTGSSTVECMATQGARALADMVFTTGVRANGFIFSTMKDFNHSALISAWRNYWKCKCILNVSKTNFWKGLTMRYTDEALARYTRKWISNNCQWFGTWPKMIQFGIRMSLVHFLLICVWTHYPPLRWRHNGHNGVSNHQPHHCLLNRLFGSKKTSKLRITGLCKGSSPGTGEFPAQMASNAEDVSIWWRHRANW